MGGRAETFMNMTSKLIRERLREKMIDPELGMNVVDLGLIYKIEIRDRGGEKHGVYILMTLTTPGCPLAAVFTPLVRQALSGIPGLDPHKDVEIELTFDPPWHQGMLSEKAKAEMGY